MLLLDNTCGRRSHTTPGCFTQLRKKRIKTLLLRITPCTVTTSNPGQKDNSL